MKTPMACDRPEVTERLTAHGLRATPARCRILGLLLETHEHYTPEEMLDELRRRGEPMSIATLYQNLAKLSEAGVIGRFVGPDGVSRYDVVTEPHHHLVCRVCGRMVDVRVKGPLEDLAPEPIFAEDAGELARWRVKGAKVEFSGVCPDCQLHLHRKEQRIA